MNVRKVSIEQVGEGQIATVSVFFPGNEVLDGSELGRLIELAREATGSRDAVTTEEVPQSAPVNPPQTTSRRRGTATAVESSGASLEAPSSPAGNIPAVEQPQLRRRRTSAEAAPAAQEGPTLAASVAGARRRGGGMSSQAEPVSATSATRVTSEKSPSTGVDTGEITVADLRKVASTGARDHGTEAVKMILEVFKGKDGKPAESVADIKPEHRRMFIDAVKGIGK